jgi:DNA-binding Xre family transcriptional regulator
MRKVRSNLDVLIARHNQQPGRGRRVSKRSLAEELSISRYTIYALAENKLDQYPRDVIESLCNFFNCDVGDLLTMQEYPEQPQS